jgi:hypothetical protein
MTTGGGLGSGKVLRELVRLDRDRRHPLSAA